MLRELADGLWVTEMSASMMGFEHGARMTVVRLKAGGLFVHSPIPLTVALRRELDAHGAVRCIVAPAKLHYEHVPELAAAYPEARVWAVPALAARLKRFNWAGALGDEPPDEWAGTLRQSQFHGSRLYDEVDFFHPASQTLILTDLCFNIPNDSGAWTRFVARQLGILGRLSASKSFGMSVKDRTAVRASLQRILEWDFDRVILSHATIVESGGKAAFRAAFERFLAAY